jgi:hypothetical protein
VPLGQVATGCNPAEERKLGRDAITVKEPCTRYLKDLKDGLVLGKKGEAKAAHDGRIERRAGGAPDPGADLLHH